MTNGCGFTKEPESAGVDRNAALEEAASVVNRRRKLLDPEQYYDEREELKIVEASIRALKSTPPAQTG